MGYSKDALKGVSWVGALRFVTRIISFLRTAILARILTPSQFGAYGVASLAVALLEVLTETGVNVILVQERDDINKYLNSAWIISIARGFIIGSVILFSASFISNFFHSQDSLPLLLLISMVPILRGFINPSIVKFQRDLQFHKEFWYRLSIFFVDGITVVIFAFITKSAISFVFGLLFGVIFEVILSFVVIKPRPSFVFEPEFLKKIMHRGKWVTASGIFNYLFYNADNIVVGRILGTTQLGLYQMGYSISILPITEVADVFSRVTFPIYSKIAKENTRLKQAFLKTLSIVSTLTIPFGVVLFLFPEEIVKIVLGNNWLGVVPALRVLAVFGVVRAISGFSSTLFLAVGKQEYVSVVTFVSILGLAVSIVPLVLSYGIVGAGISALIGSLLALPFMIYFALKIFSVV